MSEQTKPGPSEDSLDRIERLMAIEEALFDRIQADPAQRERLIREIEARMERGEFGDDGDFATSRAFTTTSAAWVFPPK